MTSYINCKNTVSILRLLQDGKLDWALLIVLQQPQVPFLRKVVSKLCPLLAPMRDQADEDKP